jgi:4,5-dihydroxyphthalate decarboxylase
MLGENSRLLASSGSSRTPPPPRRPGSAGVVPINHLIAVQPRVLEDHPHLIEQLSELFSSAKQKGLKSLPRSPDPGTEEADLVRLKTFLGDDPMPYGLTDNRAPLEMILELDLRQQVIARPAELATLFATSA